MKVKGYEIFKCDAGWRTFSFLKLTTDSRHRSAGRNTTKASAAPASPA